MTHHYLDLGSASDWLNQISHAEQPTTTTTTNQIWVVMLHQYGIFALVSQANTIGYSFCTGMKTILDKASVHT